MKPKKPKRVVLGERWLNYFRGGLNGLTLVGKNGLSKKLRVPKAHLGEVRLIAEVLEEGKP